LAGQFFVSEPTSSVQGQDYRRDNLDYTALNLRLTTTNIPMLFMYLLLVLHLTLTVNRNIQNHP